MEKALAVFMDQERPWYMELFGRPTFRAAGPGEVIVTFEEQWVIRTEGSTVILQAADGTEAVALILRRRPRGFQSWTPSTGALHRLLQQ